MLHRHLHASQRALESAMLARHSHNSIDSGRPPAPCRAIRRRPGLSCGSRNWRRAANRARRMRSRGGLPLFAHRRTSTVRTPTKMAAPSAAAAAIPATRRVDVARRELRQVRACVEASCSIDRMSSARGNRQSGSFSRQRSMTWARSIGTDGGNGGGGASRMAAVISKLVAPRERQSTRRHFEQHYAERPHIAARVSRPAAQLFGAM